MKFKYLILILILLSCNVYGISDTIFLNASIPNHNYTLSLNVTLSPGYNLSIAPINVSSRLDHIFPSTVYFNDTTELVNFTIRLNDIFLINSSLNSTFLLSNDLNSNIFNYSIITNITANPIVTVENDSYINIIDGDYIVNISENLIPKSGYLDYTVFGNYGDSLNITCLIGSWLVCPPTQYFNTDDKAIFTIYYDIPSDTSSGQHIQHIYFRTSNLTLNKSIYFNIKEPEYLYEIFQFTDDCFKYVGDNELTITYECIQAQEEFNVRRLSETITRIRAELNESCINSENEIEYIVVGNIDEDIYNELTTCKSDLSKLNDKYDLKRVDYDNSQTTISTLNKKIMDNETECLSNAVSLSARLQQEARNKEDALLIEKQSYKKSVWGGIFGIIILGGIIYGILHYLKLRRNGSWLG